MSTNAADRLYRDIQEGLQGQWLNENSKVYGFRVNGQRMNETDLNPTDNFWLETFSSGLHMQHKTA